MHSFPSVFLPLLLLLGLVHALPHPPRSPFVQASTHHRAGLTRIPTRNSGNNHLHPLVLMEQHRRRSIGRHARMKGRPIPSLEEMRHPLAKRQRDGLAMAGKVIPPGGGARTLKTHVGMSESGGHGGPGYSQAEYQAMIDNAVTEPIAPTVAGTAGFAIEANNIGYFSTVMIGSPPRPFKILMDSGSADFWVPSTACAQSQCGNHSTVGSDTSSTFQSTSNRFEVTYGTGHIEGTLAVDNVEVVPGLTAQGLTFGVTTIESTEFSDDGVPFDGLMGLARSSLSSQGVLTPIEFLASTGQVAAAQMGYKLGRLADGPQDGEVTFGGIDSSKFVGELVEFPNVNTQGFWEGAMDDASVDGMSLGMNGRKVILDTGTSLLIAPPADAAAIHAAIPGSTFDGVSGYTVPCTTNATVALSFAGESFSINPKDLTFLPVDPSNLQGDCVSAISAGAVGAENEWLAGDTFLLNVYFATSVETNTIGLGRLRD